MGKSLTVKEAANSLHCSLAMAYKLFHAGKIKGYHVGAAIRVYETSIERFKKNNENDKEVSLPVQPIETTQRKRRGIGPRIEPEFLKHLNI